MKTTVDYRGLARGMFVRGMVLMGLFVVVHLMGWREYTMILCGTAPVAGHAAGLAAYGGVAYVLCYLLATLVAPVLMIAAAVAWVVGRRLANGGDKGR